MPSRRSSGGTAITAAPFTLERRPPGATRDFGDRDTPGYNPGETTYRGEARRTIEKHRPIRNGLPAVRPYITPTLAAWYAANGQPLPAGYRPYQGDDFDLMEYTDGPRYWEDDSHDHA